MRCLSSLEKKSSTLNWVRRQDVSSIRNKCLVQQFAQTLQTNLIKHFFTQQSRFYIDILQTEKFAIENSSKKLSKHQKKNSVIKQN